MKHRYCSRLVMGYVLFSSIRLCVFTFIVCFCFFLFLLRVRLCNLISSMFLSWDIMWFTFPFGAEYICHSDLLFFLTVTCFNYACWCGYIYGSFQWTIHPCDKQLTYFKKTNIPSPLYIEISVLSQDVSDTIYVS